MKRNVSVLLGLCLSLLVTASVQARIVPDQERTEVGSYYHENDIFVDRFLKVTDIKADEESGIVTFREEQPAGGTKEDVAIPELAYVVDEATAISTSAEDFEKFKLNELPWANVAIKKEDADKINNECLRQIHVEYLGWLSSNVAFLPNAEEKQRNETLKDLGIMVGDPDGKFQPYRILSRAEMTKILVMMKNNSFADTMIETHVNYTDIDKEHWAYPYIAYADYSGIVNGYPDGSYRPEDKIKRGEFIKMLVSVLGYTEEAEKNGGYPYGYMKLAEELGLLKNETMDEEYINRTIIRTEVAELIYDSLELIK